MAGHCRKLPTVVISVCGFLKFKQRTTCRVACRRLTAFVDEKLSTACDSAHTRHAPAKPCHAAPRHATPISALFKAHFVPLTWMFVRFLFKEPASKRLLWWFKPSDSHQFSTDGRRHTAVHHEPGSRDVSRRLGVVVKLFRTVR